MITPSTIRAGVGLQASSVTKSRPVFTNSAVNCRKQPKSLTERDFCVESRLGIGKTPYTPAGVAFAVDLSRRFSKLAVFYARFYLRVRRLDEPSERCGVCGRSLSQLHMAHVLAGALQQASRVRQRCTVKKPHIYV